MVVPSGLWSLREQAKVVCTGRKEEREVIVGMRVST
jgi:hypothetical protein